MFHALRFRSRPSFPCVRSALFPIVTMLLVACGGGVGGGNENDGQFVGRTGIVIRGIVDDGTATSPVAGASCRMIDLDGNVLDSATAEADGSYLLLLDPGLQAFVSCTAPGQADLALRTFLSTAGIPAGGELDDQDVLPATTMIARIVAAEAADDPSLDVGARTAELRALIVPLGSTEAPADANLQLLADAATLAYDILRDANDDLDFDALLTDLFEDGVLDFFPGATAGAAVEAAVAARVAEGAVTTADAVLATHPGFDFDLLNVGGAVSALDEVARFATLLDQTRAAIGDRTSLTLAPGNMLGAGLTLVAGLETQDPFFDALAVDALGIDVLGAGAEDLQLGPPIFGIFLERIDGAGRMVLTDIDIRLEINSFVTGAIEATTAVLVLDRDARRMAVVSAAPENLAEISSPRQLITFTGDARIDRIQTGIDVTRASGARIVTLLTSERSLADVEALVGALEGVDVVVTLPGVPTVDTSFDGEGPLPVALATVTGADGTAVPVVPAVGNYAGLVQASLSVDPLGRVVSAATTAEVRRVAGPDEATPTVADPEVLAEVNDPLDEAVAAVVATSAGETELVLNTTAETLFVGDSNWGAVAADSVLFTSRSQSTSYGSVVPVASFVDSGTIDSTPEIPVGGLTRGDIFARVDSGQVIANLQQITPTQLQRLLEFSFANRGSGLFAQVGGMLIEFDADGTAQVLDDEGGVVVPGQRVVNVRIGDTFLIQDRAPVEGAPSITVAVSERVRDGYPLGDINFINVGVSVAQAVDAFVRVTLGGNITDEGFPADGGGRIEPFTGT